MVTAVLVGIWALQCKWEYGHCSDGGNMDTVVQFGILAL